MQLWSLKKRVYTKRVQTDAYNKMKNSLNENDIFVHVDYAESYRNNQQDEIQSGYFGNSSFSIFTACCYTKYGPMV